MIFLCFSQNLNYALGWMVIHSLWQAFLITLIVGVVLLVWQKKEAKTRYLLANAGLWTVLLAAATTFYIYYDFSRQPGDFVFVPDTSLTVRSEKAVEVSLNNVGELAVQPIGFSWEGFKNYCNNNMYFIVTLWFMGVVFFILKILGSVSYVYYLRNRMNFPADEYWQEIKDGMCEKLNITKYVDLVESAFVRSPIVVGHLKPMILFPIGAINRLNTNEVEGILAHELAHVMRHDYFFNIVQNVIEALFYYHPAVWWLSSQIRTERENCCDDIAISVCGNAMTYAKSLVSVQEMAYYSPQMAMAFAGTSRKKQLLLRVQRVLNQPKSTLNIMEKLASTSILLLLLVGFVYGGNHFNYGSPFSLNGDNIETQNTDNQLNNNTSKVFLKYDINGEIDSLPVEKHIADGSYSFENNLYSVDMTVKNQHVTAFKINGLEVDKKDLPKFQKMINELVTNQHEQEDTEMASSSTSRTRHSSSTTIADDDGTTADLKTDESGGNMPYYAPPVPPAVYAPAAPNYNCAPKYCKEALEEEIDELRSTIEEYKNDRVEVKLMASLNRELDEISRNVSKKGANLNDIQGRIDAITSKLDNMAAELDRKESENNHDDNGNIGYAYSSSNSDDDDNSNGASINSWGGVNNTKLASKFDNWLVNELSNDGYLSDTENYNFVWNERYMRVVGKTVSDKNRLKYAAMHQKITGKPMGKSFTITRNVSE